MALKRTNLCKLTFVFTAFITIGSFCRAIDVVNFGEPQIVSSPGPDTQDAAAVTVADLDDDGDLDIIAALENKVVWYENLDGSGGFGAEQIIVSTGNVSFYDLRAVDLDPSDSDTDLDIITASVLDSTLGWYANDGSQIFTPEPPITTSADSPNAIDVADIDGDGDLDILSASRGLFSGGNGTIAWYAYDNGVFQSAQVIHFAAGQPAFDVYAANFDGDSDLDLLSAYGDTIAWHANTAGSFGAPVFIATVANARAVFASDIDGDGDLDALSASKDDNTIAWYANDGSGGFGVQQLISDTIGEASALHAADIDGDGDIDVVSAAASTNSVVWHANLGGGTFSPPQTISSNTERPVSVTVGDLDGDGDLDVLSASINNPSQVAWHENFAPVNVPALPWLGASMLLSALIGLGIWRLKRSKHS